jgi:hypothetical protein
MTAVDCILVALERYSGGELERTVFSEADIVVAAWRAFPDRFGLDGYPQHPDCKRVTCELVRMQGGKRCFEFPASRRAWLERVAPKRWKVTDAGLERVKALCVTAA